MKLTPIHLIWKKPRAFTAVFAAPVLSASFSLLIDRPHWPYCLAMLGCAFVVTLTLIESLSTGCIEDNWGRLKRKDQPTRYWLQVGVWIAMYLCATLFPVIYAFKKGAA